MKAKTKISMGFEIYKKEEEQADTSETRWHPAYSIAARHTRIIGRTGVAKALNNNKASAGRTAMP